MTIPRPFESQIRFSLDTAQCNRCKILLLDDPILHGAGRLAIDIPGLEEHVHALLCGRCMLELHEFIAPSEARGPEYEAMRAEFDDLYRRASE